MNIKIGIGKDKKGWYKKFEISILNIQKEIPYISYAIIDMESDQFIQNIKNIDVVLWNPGYMGLRLSGHLKEKIFFAEKVLGKLVFPNYDTIWHFESKVAQQLLFEEFNIRHPITKISFNYDNAKTLINKTELPIVLKKSEGASSKNVRLIKKRKWLNNYVERVFCYQIWSDYRKSNSKPQMIAKYFIKRWFWSFLISQFINSDDGQGVLYLQEFLPENSADLRITMIGQKYAVAFWRNNRPGDFRASGSGLIDYTKEVPNEILQYCQEINIRLNFDSMAYDILFKDDEFFINEISYNYVDKAIFNAPGYFDLGGKIKFVKGQIWPQELWVKALLEKIKIKFSLNDHYF